MISTPILLVYIVGFLMALRPVAGHIAWSQATEYKQLKPDNGDWAWGVIAGAALSALWPIMVAFMLSGKMLPAVGAEKAAAGELAKRKVKELEAENDELDAKLQKILAEDNASKRKVLAR